MFSMAHCRAVPRRFLIYGAVGAMMLWGWREERRCLPSARGAAWGGGDAACPFGARGAAFWPRAVLGDARAWSALERRATCACFCARGLRGLRRALPAPAQGTLPLENPQARSSRRMAALCALPRPLAAGGRPLLVGLSPSTAASAPFGTKRSAHAPFSWGMGASMRCRRRWPAALPPLPPLLTPARE